MEEGRPAMVVMSWEHFASMEETLSVVREPGLMDSIRLSEHEFTRGEGIAWEKAKNSLARERI